MSGARVLRHHLADRLYHWTMAAALLTCLFTAFLPILGWKFEWVTAHWIAGIVLTVAVLFHIVRALFWQDFWSMVIGPRDLRKSWRLVARALGFGGPVPQRDAKYSPLQKSFHMLVAVVVLAIVATGLLMLSKIDTPFWRRNPYWLADFAVGINLHDPRSVRDGHDHADHGAHLLRGAPGEALDDTLDVPWMDFTRGLHAPS